jgi:hypothetical protein
VRSDCFSRCRFVVLTGNIHNRLTKGMPWDDQLEPMAYRAPPNRPSRRCVSST